MGDGLSTLDGIVLAGYVLAMLGMGIVIARRNSSTEDFFLGGRSLPSWAVGISLIASLLSTITYLGMPGEMFRTGLGFLTRQLALPMVLGIVWFLWIPFFMRLNLTSAYEYLEHRFDYTTRVIAAIFCARDDPSILSQYAKLETLHNPGHDDKGGLARRWRQPADGQESHEVEKNTACNGAT